MRRKAINFEDFFDPDRLAAQIATRQFDWESKRQKWLSQVKEVRDYVFATDTRTTTAGDLGWKNSTHLPKLCQIRDNLHSNYMAAIFPNDRAVTFESDDPETFKSGPAVEAYMRNKLRLGDFRTEIQKCVLDWIDAGNAFGVAEFVNEQIQDPMTGEVSQGFVGPKARRISPLDLTFDPTVDDFARTPKIERQLTTLSEMAILIEDYPEMGYMAEYFDKVLESRAKFAASGVGTGLDVKKNAHYQADGFSSFRDYFESDYVELLHYYGDIFDRASGTLLRNQHIVVADRMHIIRQDQHPTWNGTPPIFHVGWRVRPDNLYAMGPLDNLIGLQYRIDHLENAKADALDLIIHPVMKVRGFVEDFDYGPNERIYVGDEGDVEFMTPDATVLTADNQIQLYMQLMEEMAGAPRQAMGLRTPGEKTKFEVQMLENGANRVFHKQTTHFEIVFMEPLLNAMLETARRNFGSAESIQIQDKDFNFIDFLKVQKKDLLSAGNIRAVGARRFARKANMLQDLTTYSNTPLGQDPEVNQHMSPYKIAKLLEDLLEIEEYDIIERNVRIIERSESAKTELAAQENIREEQAAIGNEIVPPEESGTPVVSGGGPGNR